MHTRELVFFAIVLLIVGGIHLYLGRRLFGRASGLARWRRAGHAGLAFSAGLMLLAFVGGRWIPRSSAFLVVEYGGFLAMGLVLVLLPLTLARDTVLALGRPFRRRREVAPTAGELATRREFLRGLSSLGVIGSSSALSAAGVAEARSLPAVQEVDVPFEELPRELEGLRIAQISDLHLGPILGRAWLEGVVAAVNALEPDLVAVTGDLADGHVPDLVDVVAPIAKLRARHGVYFVTGNHEYYWDAEAWIAEVRRLGLTVLQNEQRLLVLGQAELVVAGVTDLSARSLLPAQRSDPARALAGAPPGAFKLLLAHQPRSVLAARKLGVDLQLSGHTHGGQFFPWNLVIGLFHPLAAGLGRFDRTWLYVSRGTGTWGPPLRTGVPAEISLIRLVRG
jgi:hypothetical protein